MNRVAPLLLVALLASPAVLAQTQNQSRSQDPRLQAFGGGTTVHHAGGPGSPGMVSATQEVFPGADVSSVNTLPPLNGPQAPSQSSLIGRATPIPINPSVEPGGVDGGQPQGQGQEQTPDDVVYPDSPADVAARKAALWEAGTASQQLRQKGIRLGQGDRYYSSIAGSPSEDDRVVLSRWKAFLPQFGVDPAKIEDESRRLPRATFDAWASRFVWLACSPHSANMTNMRPAGCDHLAE